ncbi:tripartite tricarboxylate transporter substrate binding protein [Bordetella sp. FB-8]|uniref:Bug family tripartite tricarboxylate transporter substrate binding protein n=1 Tax=Bordetella sp. FB-8 TaxID=1159870 RepID=UPI00037C178C|nr:tripartite tricarboxylate transporter substrate binding protein [Bordetella sp. FB-8]
MKKSRSLIAIATLCLAFTGVAIAQQSKPLRIIVSFSPGGPVDTVARTLAPQLAKEMGRDVIVENRPGANGAIGAGEVMRSEPDGNTLWITSVGAAAINSSLYPKLTYNMQRDFAPVSLVVNNVELLVVNKNNPAKNAIDFVAEARKSKEPMTMATSGIGSIPHLAVEQLMEATGVKLLPVPYKGAAPAITDLMGGQVSGFFGDVPGLIGYVRGGALKALGIASSKRSPLLPNVKTLEEQGIRGVDTNNWYALFAPIKTPPDVVAAVNKAVRNALSDPAVREKLLALGTDPVSSTPKELALLVKHDTEKWAKLIRAKNIRAN